MKIFGVSVLLIRAGQILGIGRRNNPNDWGLPGGKGDLGETPEQAAVRECFEETGLTIKNVKHIFTGQCGDDMAMTFTGDFEGEPQTQSGEPECKWCEPLLIMNSPTFGEYNTQLFKKIGIKT